MILQCYIGQRTLLFLSRVAEQSGRTIAELAECAIAEAALDAHRRHPDAHRKVNTDD
jgi:hypothetical protein